MPEMEGWRATMMVQTSSYQKGRVAAPTRFLRTAYAIKITRPPAANCSVFASRSRSAKLEDRLCSETGLCIEGREYHSG